jgi:hypothetical protein
VTCTANTSWDPRLVLFLLLFPLFTYKRPRAHSALRRQVRFYSCLYCVIQRNYFTMSGLEIAAAVFGIIGGIASATKMIKDLRELYLKRKNGRSSAARTISETIEQRLDRLEEQLRISELALEQEAQEVSRLNWGRHGKSSVQAVQ